MPTLIQSSRILNDGNPGKNNFCSFMDSICVFSKNMAMMWIIVPQYVPEDEKYRSSVTFMIHVNKVYIHLTVQYKTTINLLWVGYI